MIFKTLTLNKDLILPPGAVLAHSQAINGNRINKGSVLKEDDLKAFIKNDIHSIPVAIPDPTDIDENEAAELVAKLISGGGVDVRPSKRGRANIYAKSTGLLEINEKLFSEINFLNEKISIATLENYTPVIKGQLIATAKIIPFFIDKNLVNKAANKTKSLNIKPFVNKKTILLSTRSPLQKNSLAEKAVKSTLSRLKKLGLPKPITREIEHKEEYLIKALIDLKSEDYDCLLISSALATTDINDLIPLSIKKAGGTITRFGLPVDPGNLTIIGEYNKKPLIGIPGCARSKKLNGFDWVLERVLADIPISNKDYAKMGIGGLLKEMPDRPEPREPKLRSIKGDNISLILLAAGRSSRMGPKNKLTELIFDKPMISQTSENIQNLPLLEKLIILGHEAEKIRPLINEGDFQIIKNENYKSGISTSIKAGVSNLDTKSEGVIILLADMPMVQPQTLDILIKGFQKAGPDKIIIPTWQGKRGNPVLIGKKYYDNLLELEGDRGAQQIFNNFEDQIVLIEVEDSGVCWDIDTLEALKKFKFP